MKTATRSEFQIVAKSDSVRDRHCHSLTFSPTQTQICDRILTGFYYNFLFNMLHRGTMGHSLAFGCNIYCLGVINFMEIGEIGKSLARHGSCKKQFIIIDVMKSSAANLLSQHCPDWRLQFLCFYNKSSQNISPIHSMCPCLIIFCNIYLL